jgi:ABC-2 type transport system ATP-binding protein
MVSINAIECVHISKKYHNGKVALSDISITFPKGSIFAILGRNGAGKTTFLRIAATQLLPTSGKMSVLGLDIIKDVSQIRHKIAVLPQDARPLGPLSTWDQIYYNLLITGMSRADARIRANKTIEDLELQEYKSKPSNTLSGGLRQRILLAMCIATDAEFLFLDEPTLAQDPLSRNRIWEVIRQLRYEERTIFLTTNNLDEAERLADQVAIINNGSVLARGTIDELKLKIQKSVRVDISSGISLVEAKQYGEAFEEAGRIVVLCSEREAKELTALAVTKSANFNVSPIKLEGIFSQLITKG